MVNTSLPPLVHVSPVFSPFWLQAGKRMMFLINADSGAVLDPATFLGGRGDETTAAAHVKERRRCKYWI